MMRKRDSIGARGYELRSNADVKDNIPLPQGLAFEFLLIRSIHIACLSRVIEVPSLSQVPSFLLAAYLEIPTSSTKRK